MTNYANFPIFLLHCNHRCRYSLASICMDKARFSFVLRFILCKPKGITLFTALAKHASLTQVWLLLFFSSFKRDNNFVVL
jgi:hypothetical protein